MNSGKQRRIEIKQRRLDRARVFSSVYRFASPATLPVGAVFADAVALQHNTTVGLWPLFYVARPFVCRDCAAGEVWTAKQQKWWYESAKGNINSVAVRCRACRGVERRRVEAARAASVAGIKKKQAQSAPKAQTHD